MPELRVVIPHQTLALATSSSCLSSSASVSTSSVPTSPDSQNRDSPPLSVDSNAPLHLHLDQHRDDPADIFTTSTVSLLPSTIVESLLVLQMQEEKLYQPPTDYLTVIDNAKRDAGHKVTDAVCRTKMCHWCMGIAQACEFGLESVWIAMSYLDRTLSADPLQFGLDRHTFQLAVMACLYIAAKLHEPVGLSSKQVAAVSKGKFTFRQVEEMECKILFALQWKLHPISPHAYWRWLLPCLDCMVTVTVSSSSPLLSSPLQSPSSVSRHGSTLMFSDHDRTTILTVAETQLELALPNYDVAGIGASILAYCAMVNAFDHLQLTNINQGRRLRWHHPSKHGRSASHSPMSKLRTKRAYFQQMLQHALGWDAAGAANASSADHHQQQQQQQQQEKRQQLVMATGQRLWELLVASDHSYPCREQELGQDHCYGNRMETHGVYSSPNKHLHASYPSASPSFAPSGYASSDGTRRPRSSPAASPRTIV